MNVLIIENELFLAENLSTYFEKNNEVDVQYTTRGDSALKILSDKHYDLVVSDLRLSDLENDDWLLEIGKLNPGQRLIVISSYDMPKNLSLSKKLNIIGYFEKPFDIKIISNLIKKITN